MLEVTFDIPTIKKLYPELNRCFGFTYDDISNELTQVYTKKAFNLTAKLRIQIRFILKYCLKDCISTISKAH